MARIEKSIDVDVPLATAYKQWTQFEQFPRFMEGVREVRQIDSTHLRWTAEIGLKDKEWDAEITELVPAQRISWRSMAGAAHGGTVSFQPLGTSMTRVNLAIDYDPEGFIENIGDLLGVTSRRVQGDLERFRNLVEGRGVEVTPSMGSVIATSSIGTEGSAMPSSSQPAAGALAGMGGTTPRVTAASPVEDERRLAERRTARVTAMPGASSRQRAASPGVTSGTPTRLPSTRGGFWEEPFAALRRASDEMEQMFERFVGRPLAGAAVHRPGVMATMWAPQIDVCERGDQLVISVDLPGIRNEDVHVDIHDDVLIIEGERREESETTEQGYARMERSYGRFLRTIPLPEGIDISAARASMHAGVLEITMPAPKRAQGRRLDIHSEEPTQAQRRSG